MRGLGALCVGVGRRVVRAVVRSAGGFGFGGVTGGMLAVGDHGDLYRGADTYMFTVPAGMSSLDVIPGRRRWGSGLRGRFRR